MTEPRKTPRSDALWRDPNARVFQFVQLSRALESETQELAEAIATALTEHLSFADKSDDYTNDARIVLSDALARHRAKQEVQS